MTTNSTLTDLERRVARAMLDCEEWSSFWSIDEAVILARAALKAHAEWLEEQGLEIVCTGRPHSRRPTIEVLEKILEGPAGRVRITPAGEVVIEPAQQEDQS